MSYTQADLDALNKAMAQGVKKVVYRDRTVEYRDLSEMNQIQRKMEVALGKIKRSTRIYMGTSKGL